MKKADNFNPGQWLVENKLTNQSQLNEMPVVGDPTSTAIKNYILRYFNYDENDFESYTNFDTDLDDFVAYGEYDERIFFDDNEAPDDFYERLIKMIKSDTNTEHKSWGDRYAGTWFLKTYPFNDSGEDWTEYLHVDIQLPKDETDINVIFSSRYAQTIEIFRTVPFNEDMKQWWIASFGDIL